MIQDDLLSEYQVDTEAYDEFLTWDGALRPSWEPVYEHFQAIGRTGLNESARLVQRLVRDSSITQTDQTKRDSNSTYDGSIRRPWQLDPIPWVIGTQEWEQLCQGLKQRAHLLNLVTADLYGPQRLISDGILPSGLLFYHPAYQRSFQNLPVKDNRYLHFYTADLAKGADGRWYVIADRTDAPLGIGYTLENRLVLSRTFQNVFRETEIERLAPFFVQLRKLLHQLSPQPKENPRIVLLTEGPRSAGYFEDVYLSRYLGYMLVEGGDLTVRDDRVMLKTLGGLLQVDVIYRRMTDQWCDPLELQSDASQGIAGLTRAIRANNVAVANALGSSLVESGAFLPYWDQLSRELLQQPLLIPSVETYWGGSLYGAEAIQNRSPILVRSAFRNGRDRVAPPITAIEMGGDPRLQIAEHPWDYIGQVPILRSKVPSWRDGKLIPMHAALRVYLVASDDGYQVLPGGLARIACENETLEQDVLAGQNSKEVWVRASGPVSQVSLLRKSTLPKQELRRASNELPSRVADNLLWLGRYVERLEGGARLFRTALQRLVREADPHSLPEWPGIVRQLADRGLIEPDYAVEGLKDKLPALADRLPHILLEDKQSGSLRGGLRKIMLIASGLRDRLSPDSWDVLHFLEQRFEQETNAPNREPEDAISMLGHLIRDLSAFLGMIAESMTRTLAWRSLDLGRRIERSLGSVAIVHQLCGTGADEPAEWEAMVEANDSLMTYRFRYLASWSLDAVIDLLLTDDTNPRSFAYQVTMIAEHVQQLANASNPSGTSPEKQQAAKILQQLKLIDAEVLAEVSEKKTESRLFLITEEFLNGMHTLFNTINTRYVVHSGRTRNRGK